MKSPLILLAGFQLGITATLAHAGVLEARETKCNVAQAEAILQSSISTGAAFCSSYFCVTTKTKTSTSTVTASCQTKTKTKTEHTTFTTTIYGKTTTLPTITKTEYSTSVLIPSGPSRSVSKRDVTPAYAGTTPTALSNCKAPTISAACSSLYNPMDKTTTVTSTITTKCANPVTTTTTTTITDATATSRVPFLISPAPIIVSATGTLTTTVPAACAASPYYPNGNGVGNLIIPTQYPVFAQSAVECCVACYQVKNCVASAVIIDDSDGLVVECDLLIHTNGTAAGTSKTCPLGIQDYPFGDPVADGNVYPGPCGM